MTNVHKGKQHFLLLRHVIHVCWLATCLVLFLAPSASSQQRDMTKMTDEQLNALSKDEFGSLPAKEFFLRAIGKSAPDIYNLMISRALESLAYFSPERSAAELEEAIRKFRRDSNSNQTGPLKLGEMTELMRRSGKQSTLPIYVAGGDKIFISRLDDYLRVSGLWIIENDQIAFPVNSSEISCQRSWGVCSVFDASLQVPKVSEGEPSESGLLLTNVTQFQVTKWTADEVVSEATGICRATTMSINSKTNEVFQITRNVTNGCNLGIGSLPALTSPRVAKLIPGFQTTYEFWKRRGEEARQFMSLEYRNRVTGIADQEKR